MKPSTYGHGKPMVYAGSRRRRNRAVTPQEVVMSPQTETRIPDRYTLARRPVALTKGRDECPLLELHGHVLARVESWTPEDAQAGEATS